MFLPFTLIGKRITIEQVLEHDLVKIEMSQFLLPSRIDVAEARLFAHEQELNEINEKLKSKSYHEDVNYAQHKLEQFRFIRLAEAGIQDGQDHLFRIAYNQRYREASNLCLNFHACKVVENLRIFHFQYQQLQALVEQHAKNGIDLRTSENIQKLEKIRLQHNDTVGKVMKEIQWGTIQTEALLRIFDNLERRLEAEMKRLGKLKGFETLQNWRERNPNLSELESKAASLELFGGNHLFVQLCLNEKRMKVYEGQMKPDVQRTLRWFWEYHQQMPLVVD